MTLCIAQLVAVRLFMYGSVCVSPSCVLYCIYITINAAASQISFLCSLVHYLIVWNVWVTVTWPGKFPLSRDIQQCRSSLCWGNNVLTPLARTHTLTDRVNLTSLCENEKSKTFVCTSKWIGVSLFDMSVYLREAGHNLVYICVAVEWDLFIQVLFTLLCVQQTNKWAYSKWNNYVSMITAYHYLRLRLIISISFLNIFWLIRI